MALFGDLPPPASDSNTSSVSLFDDLPPETSSSGNPEHEEACASRVNKRPSSVGTDHEEGEDESTKKKTKHEVSFQFKVFVAERKGERDEMQDGHQSVQDLLEYCKGPAPPSVSRLSYYAVFDGHNGARASRFAADTLHKNIAVKFPKGEVQNLDREVKKCLTEAFKRTDDEFLQQASACTPSWKDGSTAVAILVVNDVIYAAGIGDSKAVLAREGIDGEPTPVALTKDHSPVVYEERTRIQKAGGFVREGRVSGILEVSRSFGDGRFKHCGVVCTPDVIKCTLTHQDRFVLAACDGLWKVFTAQEALTFVTAILKDDSIVPPPEPVVKSTNFAAITPPTDVFGYRCEVACNKMAVEAVTRGCADNVTIMLVPIYTTQLNTCGAPDC